MPFRHVLLLAAFIPAIAQGEVKSASSRGFETENQLVVKASPGEAYRALGRIGAWWSSDHTYSGKAENLSLELKAGGCFCERLEDGGSVEHMRVVLARPGAMLRLEGALGPLQEEAVKGNLTWSFKEVPGGTEITQNYLVDGYFRRGGEQFAAPVDMVLSQQLAGLARLLGR